ncbi:MAG: C25 family cysteine peptidase [Verrucomicrobiota bacterium]
MKAVGPRLAVALTLALPLAGAFADVSVESVASNTMHVSFWAGRAGLAEQTVIRLGRQETRPAPQLDGASPDCRRFGAPALPFVTCQILLPPSTRAGDVVITQSRYITPFAVPKPLAFINQPYNGYDMTDPAQVQAWREHNCEDAQIYSSDADYPAEAVAFTTRNFRGYAILELSFTPFQYNPVRGALQLSQHLELSIRLEPDDGQAGVFRVRDSAEDREIVRRMVVNSTAADAYRAPPRPLGKGGPGTNYYVIITSTAWATNFEPLRTYHSYDANHHARIDKLEDIYALYPATNPPFLSVRSYVMDTLYPNGCDYVLLGGDIEVITSCWEASDISYSGGQIPVGRFSVDTEGEIANCIAKSTNPVPNGKDRVQLIPRADEYGPTLNQYSNLFLPYLEVDTDSSLYSAQPIFLFPAMDAHTILWARGHGYYLYPQWAYGWYTPNNTNLQPFGFNFGCSGAVLSWNEHPAEVYQRARYGNTAYIGSVHDVYANSYDETFFETYFLHGTAPDPCVGDMAVAAGANSEYTLVGDPRFRLVSTQFMAKARVTVPPPTSFSRTYNIEDGTNYVQSAVFRVNSFNACPWVITNISASSAFSNHYQFSCLASNGTADVTVSFLEVSNLLKGTYDLTWDVRDVTNNFQIKRLNMTLIVTDKNILSDTDFIHSGTTNILPAGAYILAAHLVVNDGLTLQLEPGVSLYTDYAYGSDWRIIVQQGGKLVAQGTATNQIAFCYEVGGSVPIEIYHTDLMPLSADFQYCDFQSRIYGTNRPCVRFVNCTFQLGMGMEPIFPAPLEGSMKNCLFTAGTMGNYSDPGDLTGMAVSYTCIAPSTTNKDGSPTPFVPVHHTYGERTIWGNDFVVNGWRLPGLLSTCINAGDPTSPPDPDGTRADIGAYYRDLSVAVHVPGDYATIQAGLNAAAAVTTAVIVAPGEYRERIRVPEPSFDEGVRLMGESETNRPVLILTNDPGDLVAFDGNGFIENFVLRHTGSNGMGRAMCVTNGGSVGLRNVEFSGNCDNSDVLFVGNPLASVRCIYLSDVDFANNASNGRLLSIERELQGGISAPWSWFQRGRFTNNTANGTVFYYAANERYFPARELLFHDNQASSLIRNAAGGTANTTTLKIVNALFSGNIGDIRTEDAGHTLLENCTFYNNASNILATGMTQLRILNSIVWDNALTITNDPGAILEVNCTDINSAYPGAGFGNMNTNPLFADEAAGDFSLLCESLCIDAGGPESFYANEPAPNGSRVDLGRYGNTPDATPWTWWTHPNIRCPSNTVELTVTSVSGQWYCVETADSLFDAWTAVSNLCTTGSVLTVIDPMTRDQGFYRIHHFRP